MLKHLEKFTDLINGVLALVMAIVILVSLIQGLYTIAFDLLAPPLFVFKAELLLEMFGIVLFVLLGIELLEIVKDYEAAHHINVQTVFLVALIAIARKLIITDVAHTDGFTLIGIAAIIITLSAGYFVIKQTDFLQNGGAFTRTDK